MLPFGRKASPSCIARAIVVNDRVALLAGSNPAIDRLSVRFPFSRTTSSSVPRGISIVGVSRILGTSTPGWLWSRGVGFAIRYPHPEVEERVMALARPILHGESRDAASSEAVAAASDLLFRLSLLAAAATVFPWRSPKKR
jgi:hypothetical protein